MKSILFSFISVVLLTLNCACQNKPDPNKQIDEGKVKGTTYHSNEIGWTIEIPKDWEIVTKDKAEASTEKGRKILEKANQGEVDMQNLKHLISFQKDRFNLFSSSSELFKEEYPGEYAQNYISVKEMLCNAFASQGIKTDTSSNVETIGGLSFNAFYITIYAPGEEKKVILNQIMYSRLINGYDFGANINYNNEKDKEAMLKAWKNSTFIKTLKSH